MPLTRLETDETTQDSVYAGVGDLIAVLSENRGDVCLVLEEMVRLHSVCAIHQLAYKGITGEQILELVRVYPIDAKNLFSQYETFYTDHIHAFANYLKSKKCM